MKTKLLLVLVIALTAGIRSRAQTSPPMPAPATPSSSWLIQPSFVTQYMFRGTRLGGPSFQPTVEYDAGNLALGIWSNFPIADKVAGQSDPEIDPYGSYKFVVTDALSLQPGFTLYTYKDAKENNGFYKYTFEPYVALNYTISGVVLTPKIYYDTVLKGATYEFNAGYAVPLKDAGTELDFTGTVGAFKWTDALENTSPSAKNWGNYWQVGVGAPFQISKDAKFTIGWAYTRGTGNFTKIGSTPKVANTAAVGRGVLTFTYAMTF